MKCFSRCLAHLQKRSSIILIPVAMLTFINLLCAWKDIYRQDEEFENNKQQVSFLMKKKSLDNTILMNNRQLFKEASKNARYFIVRRRKRLRKRRQRQKAIHHKISKSQTMKYFKSVHKMVVSMKRNGSRVSEKKKDYSTKANKLSGQPEVKPKVSEVAWSYHLEFISKAKGIRDSHDACSLILVLT